MKGSSVEFWTVMEQAGRHTFQILTKRPERMLEVLSQPKFSVLPNVWLGTSVESRDYLDRIDTLRRVPAAIRFISFEPLLGPIVAPGLRGFTGQLLAAKAARERDRWSGGGQNNCATIVSGRV